MELLFSQIADIIFTLPDGSELLCTTTLNSDILRRYGYDDVNSFIDLSCMKLIPESSLMARRIVSALQLLSTG